MSRPPSTPTLPARLATSDWVVLARPDQGPLGFLGKVTDGEWDRRDDALLRARVDTTRSKPLWFAAGDLERVEPSDEADLVEAALARGLVPSERAARLRADVEALRERRLPFVRSPGLLDRLWAALPAAPEQGTGGLAAFFDEGRRALLEARDRRHTPGPARRAPEAVHTPPRVPAAARAIEVPRVTTRGEAVRRILDALPFDTLKVVRARLLGDGPAGADVDHPALLLELTTTPPTLPALLDALPEGALEPILPILGFPHLRPGRRRRGSLAAQLCGLLREPRGHVPARAAPPPAPDRVHTHEEAVVKILDALPFEELWEVRARLLGPGPLQGFTSSSMRTAVLQELLATRPTLSALLDALPGGTLQALLPVLGYPRLQPGRDVTLEQHLCQILRGPPEQRARTLDEAETVARLVAWLPVESLRLVRAQLQRDGRLELAGVESSRDALVAALIRARPALAELLGAVPQSAFSALVQAIGPVRFEGPAAVVMTELLEGLRRLDPSRSMSSAATAASTPSSPSTSPRDPDRPLPPTSLAEATTRVLGVVRGPQLPALCDRLGVARPTWSDPGEARANIVAAGRPLRDLVAALPPSAVGHLGYLLGVPRGAGTYAELAAHVLARVEPRLEAAPHLALLLEELPDEARRPFVRDLGAVAPEPATVDRLVAALLAADVTPLEVLDALQPSEVTRAARRFGLAGAADPVAELRALVTQRAPETP